VDKKTQSAIFIDPLPALTERLKTLLTCQGLNLVAVIDTHGHGDHPSCRGSLADDYLAQQQTDMLGWPVNSNITIVHGRHYPYIVLGDKWLVKINTPGHTIDSTSLLLCDPLKASTDNLLVHFAFCGDLILMDSLGRTNFSTSSATAMYSSLQLLKALIGTESLICPSHDYNHEFTTSITAEISRNLLLAQVIADQINIEKFLIQKTLMDTHIIDQSGSEIMCGALIGDPRKVAVREYTSCSLTKALEQPNNIMLIDLRESYEYTLGHDKHFKNNVPLTQLVEFAHQHKHNKQQPLVLVCRTGSRSQLAAQTLLRLGFEHVGHLKGGYALHQY
jgi:cysteine desulfurase